MKAIEYIDKLFLLLTESGRKKVVLLQLLFVVSAVMQVAGVGSIAPFIAVISDPDLVNTNPVFSGLYVFVRAETRIEFILRLALIVMFLIALGNLLAALSMWFLNKVSIEVGLSIQKKMLQEYLKNDYVFFTRVNSSRLTSVISQEIPRFIYMVLQPLLNITSQVFVFIIIVIGLIYLNPFLAAISLTVILAIYLLIYQVIKPRLLYHGNVISKNNSKKIRSLNECIEGIKFVKLKRLEKKYIDALERINMKTLGSSAFIGLAGDIPRFVVETIIFICILILSLYLVKVYGDSGEVVTILSLYAMAGYKLLPAVQVIYKSASLIKANGAIVDELIDEFGLSEEEGYDAKANLKLTPGNVISSRITCSGYEQGERFGKSSPIILRNVSYAYSTDVKNVLDGVSITISENGITAIVGASGAGKSTLVDILLGLLKPSSGIVCIGGQKLDGEVLDDWQKIIGYVPQTVFLLDDTIRRNIAFGVNETEIDNARIQLVSKLACLDDFISQLPGKYDYIVGERGGLLSGGQIQRIGLARALYSNPKILFLDEATSALDNRTESQVMEKIKSISKDIIVIMIAHRSTSISWADNVIYLENGKVKCKGLYADLIEKSKDFKDFMSAAH